MEEITWLLFTESGLKYNHVTAEDKRIIAAIRNGVPGSIKYLASTIPKVQTITGNRNGAGSGNCLISLVELTFFYWRQI